MQRLAALPPRQYWWRAGLEMLALTLVISELVSLLIPETRTLEVDHHVLVYMVLIAPFAETLLMVTLPASLARLFSGGKRLRFLAIFMTFTLLHYSNNLNSMLSAGLIGGLYYGFTYIHWHPRSKALAFWMPVAMHGCHNGVLVALYLVTKAVFDFM